LGFPIPEAERAIVAEAQDNEEHHAARRTQALNEYEQAKRDALGALARRRGSSTWAQEGFASVRKEIMRTGVDSQARPSIWATELHTRSKRAASSSAYAAFIAEGTSERQALTQEQVENDLRRTFPSHPCFRDAETPGWTCLLPHLRRVLCALAARCVDGYCQGLSYIAAFLLLVHMAAAEAADASWQWDASHAPPWAAGCSPAVEEDVFWIMVCLLENVLPGFYSTSLDGVRTEVSLVENVVASSMPTLHQHLEAHGLPVSMAVFEWLMAAFTTKVPSLTLLHVWDMLLIGGRDALLHTTYVMLANCEAELHACHTSDACMQFLKDKACRRHDHTELAAQVLERWLPLHHQHTERLEATRLYCAQQVQVDTVKMRRRLELQRTFQEFAYSNAGSLSREDFTQLLQKVFEKTGPRSHNSGTTTSSGCSRSLIQSVPACPFGEDSRRPRVLDDCQLLSNLFDAIDTDMDGYVNWQEFVQASRAYPWLLGNFWGSSDCHFEDRLRLLFNEFDVDGNGALDREELATFVETVYKAVGAGQAKRRTDEAAQRACAAEAGHIFDTADLDGNGVITFQEFEAAASAMPVLVLGTRLLSTSVERRALSALAEVGAFSAVITGISMFTRTGQLRLDCNANCGRFSGGYAGYHLRVEVEHPTRPFTVRRRYSEFLALQRRVAEVFRTREQQEVALFAVGLPAFPPKTGLSGGKCSEATINYRRTALQSYLDGVRRMPDAEVQAILRQWLGLPFRQLSMRSASE